MRKRVEGDDADRIVELPRYQIGDDRFEVRPLDVGLAVGRAKTAKVVGYKGALGASSCQQGRRAGSVRC
jgi:hypothetical protein